MATQTLPNSSLPSFSRLTEGRATSSWKAAIPIVVAVVAVIAALAYLASQLTSSSEKLAAAQRDSEAARQSVDGFQKQASQLQAENALLKSAGRTTVMLESATPAAKGKTAKGSAEASPTGWAAATWGEAVDGKSWMRVAAYGLQAPADGKSYHLWFTPVTGAPVDAGKLDPAADGSAFAMMKDLPAVDQGKSLAVSLDDDTAKAQGEALMTAKLPTLKPSAAPKSAAAAPAAKADAAAPAAPPAAAKTEAAPAARQ